jgi:serine/threonine-protein kinase SRPK3
MMSGTTAPQEARRAFDQSVTAIQINEEDDGEVFECDEEPHMLSPQLGYGYYPLMLGQRLHEDKYEIVRKLGWGGYSSVWLAKECRFVDTRAVASG